MKTCLLMFMVSALGFISNCSSPENKSLVGIWVSDCNEFVDITTFYSRRKLEFGGEGNYDDWIFNFNDSSCITQTDSTHLEGSYVIGNDVTTNSGSEGKELDIIYTDGSTYGVYVINKGILYVSAFFSTVDLRPDTVDFNIAYRK